MPGRKFIYKKFAKTSLQDQVYNFRDKPSESNDVTTIKVDIVEILPKVTTTKKRRKNIVNQTHKQVKELIGKGNYKKAAIILKTALDSGYKGKRLDKWKEILMASKSSNLFTPIKRQKKKKTYRKTSV